ncbi:MAG TPA: D-alanyl-D-alanine carboxypeptidase family protein [Candidatus Dormibacteraeota bacterium]|jgi:D-alanyl-D-alanine carboxypeptidase (penicillin-binding protein 5/6)|nr:D-alanyl-D-alanine carboxypeptidase family protein [Candidatus Dormibacteraeota bacterium]
MRRLPLLLAVLLLAGACGGAPTAAQHDQLPAARRPSPSPRPTPTPLTFSTSWMTMHPPPPLHLGAVSAVLVDMQTDQVLWSKNDTAQLPPASLTKMLTVAVALRHVQPNTMLTVPASATKLPGEDTTMGLTQGEQLSVEDLLYGIFMESANDAALVLAQDIIPEPRFLAQMNQLARAWGVGDAAFTDPTGLDQPGLHASALDLAVIAGHLETDDPEVMAIAGTREIDIAATKTHKDYDLESVNGLVLRGYPGITGLKTGFTDNAGYCVTATATRGGRSLIAVVLNSETDLDDAKKLLDYGFASPADPLP